MNLMWLGLGWFAVGVAPVAFGFLVLRPGPWDAIPTAMVIVMAIALNRSTKLGLRNAVAPPSTVGAASVAGAPVNDEPVLRDWPDDLLNRTYRRAMNVIFLREDPTKPFRSKLALFYIACVMIVTIALAEPHVRYLVLNYFNVSCLSENIKDSGKQWCDFATVFSQITLVLIVGGIVITEDAVHAFRAMALRTESSYQDARRKMIVDIDNEYSKFREFLKDTSGPRKVSEWIKETWRLVNWSPKTRVPLQFVISIRFVSAFPAGLYGYSAFFGLSASLRRKLLKPYLITQHSAHLEKVLLWDFLRERPRAGKACRPRYSSGAEINIR
jgi:hypothetical protein